ncbi:MAG: bifunctional folylpolyglutamate synthase/dihydrofolate synthase [Dehalococcoidia bacterium]|nr:bifunctional folylpolyglutamate synthase/dihydrofolate synthase [Dehalococcoidia bacterium]
MMAMKADIEAYHAAIEYLESFIKGPPDVPADPYAIEVARKKRIPATRALLELFGSPQERFKSVHISGTSGKGSTCTMVAQVLMEAGYKVGLHTSPYLQTPIEKAMINGRYMDPDVMVELIDSSKAIISRFNDSEFGPVSYTQLWVALMLSYFAREAVDVAVVEVGVGGRYDFTNVLSPEVTAITNVSMDHAESLGPTLEDIAWHKAGIAKRGTPMVTGVDPGGPLQVIEDECRAMGSPLYRVGHEISYEIINVDPSGSSFRWNMNNSQLNHLEVGLLGAHQISNASVALGVIQCLKERGLHLSEEAIRAGLKDSRVPGRLEVLAERPTVVIDGAHNPAKARTLRDALAALFTYRHLVLVLGVIASKEASEIAKELAPLASSVITTATGVTGKPFIPPEEMARIVYNVNTNVAWENDPMLAVDKALSIAGGEDLVCITGSIYLIGKVRERWVPLVSILEGTGR